jgi:DNA-binding transcriptional regulator YbjK
VTAPSAAHAASLRGRSRGEATGLPERYFLLKSTRMDATDGWMDRSQRQNERYKQQRERQERRVSIRGFTHHGIEIRL